MNDFIIWKIGNIELYGHECKRYLTEKLIYLVSYRTVYELHYSVNAGYYGIKVYYSTDKLPLTKRGRFVACNADYANKLIGHEIFCA